MKDDYQFITVNGQLQLVCPESSGFKPLCVDFSTGKNQHRRQFRGRELIAKAVGYKQSEPPCIIDATAGLGRDAFVLASLGCQVTLLERHPVLFQLLEDGIKRARENDEIAEIAQRMILFSGNAIELLSSLNADVIYLDPMYPHRKKSAQVKKEMQILQDVVGADGDSEQLLSAAFSSSSKRIVVKRPKNAESLAGKTPQFSCAGKHSRFDVYVNKR